MTGRPHVVQATFQLPHRRGGGTARQFHLLRELAQEFDVTVIAPQVPGLPDGAVGELARFATPVLVRVPSWSSHPLRRAARLAQMVATPRPHASSGMDPLKAPIRAALAALPRSPDVFYVEPSTVADWCDLAPDGCARVLGYHDLTFAAMRERARVTNDRRARAMLEVEWRRMRWLELHQARRVNLNIAISALEQRELWRLAPSARTVFVANGVDVDYFARPAGSAPDPAGPLLLVGSLNHPPNIDAAQRMAREILPLLRGGGRDVRLQLVGRSPVAEIHALAQHEGVHVVGEVADVRPYLAAAALVCVPITFGGGIRVKILDALAAGCAVVTTPKGVEGLGARDGEHLRIAPMERFAAAVAELLDRPERAARLASDGRSYVDREHGWAASGRVLRAAFGGLLR